jgi:hypothetical protein
MDTNPNDDPVRAEARRQVRALRAFYMHAAIYATVMVMLVLINIATGDAWRGNWWIQWPARSWGAVVLIHGIIALRGSTLFGPEWEERKIDEIVSRRKH